MAKKKYTRKSRIRHIKIELGILAVLLVCLGFSVYRYLSIRPGWVELETMKATARTDTMITLEWKEVRNAARYEVYYKVKGTPDEEALMIESEEPTVTMNDLKDGTGYTVFIKAFTDENVEGIESYKRVYKTKMRQQFEARDSYVKLTSSSKFNIARGSRTVTSCTSSNEEVAKVADDGTVTIKGAGSAKLTVTARESKDYVEASKTIKLTVIRSLEKDAGKATMEAIATIGSGDVTKVIQVSGADGAVVPQSLAYTGDKYIIAFGMAGKQRIVSCNTDGTGRKVYVPSHNLGHPNGFTYDYTTKLCYSLRGNSTSVDTFDPATGKFGKTRMPYGAAGICYDRAQDVLYTTSGTGIRQYSSDGKFKHKKLIPNIRHTMFLYTQDSGAHAGYVFRCMSGKSKHTVNYLELYRVKDSKYLGSFRVNGLGELESAIVDNDGYIELLVNSGNEYIYRTKLRPEDFD